ncbi:Hypothetical predicted protein [Scomber scombrus]|uniref:Uncharacterized protein n=1 Tax=Scomber scombrus TaxID=13677 RepID=A0AAV1NCX1_SCOSC
MIATKRELLCDPSGEGSGLWFSAAKCSASLPSKPDLETCLLSTHDASGCKALPSAGGDDDENDQCCQAGEGDLKKMVAPQWGMWVVSSSPQLLKGSRVKSGTLKPTNANIDSQL